MRAVGISRFGGPEVLEVVELPDPLPEAGQIRVRVAAATVNPTDTWLRVGRTARFLEGIDPPWIPGMELAGTVDAVGPDVDWQIGERVMAVVLPLRKLGGAQAELVVVDADSVARVPDSISLELAATIPMNGLTARLALDLLALRPGEWLAVTGAAGAVGGYAMELAKLDGLMVAGDASPTDRELVRRLGADVVVERSRDSSAMQAAIPGGADAALDVALMGAAILPAVRDGGQVAAIRKFEGASERGIVVRPVWINEYAKNHAALHELGELAAQGRLTLRVAESFPPERAADAHRKLEAGGTRGRLIIEFK